MFTAVILTSEPEKEWQ